MASIFDRDGEAILVNCDCGIIMADVPDAEQVQCHDCGRRYRVYGGWCPDVKADEGDGE